MIGGGFITIDGDRIDEHEIASVTVSQELNTHWWCDVEFQDTPDQRIPAEEMLGKDLTVTGMGPDGSDVPVFSGFVLESELIYEPSGRYRAQLRAVSWSCLMDLTPRREYYYQLTASDVAKKLVANTGLPLKGDVDGPKLSYVQTAETDFHFLLRLADESEKWLRPTDDGVEVQGAFQSGGTLDWRGEHGLRHFSVSGRMSQPGSAGAHYDYRKMKSQIAKQVKDQPDFYESSSRMVDAVKTSSATLTADFSGERHRMLPVDDLQPRLKKESRRSLGRGVTCWGVSLQQTLKAGDEVAINGVLDARGTYGLVRVVHRWTSTGYENEFSCTPWKKFTGPEPPVAPRFGGVVAARVTDNNDPENLGRIQVQYFWQEASHTCWLRLMTPHAGADRGFMFLPEIGDEVWVMFEEGDPERARIVGSGWNGVHQLPREEFWGGDVQPNDIKRIVTKSGHRITIVDKPGKNSMVLATPNHLKISMIENSNETGDAMLTLHSDGDILLSAPKGRIHTRSKLFSKEVGSAAFIGPSDPVTTPSTLLGTTAALPAIGSTPLPPPCTIAPFPLAPGMSCQQKMAEAIERAPLGAAVKAQIGDPWVFAGEILVVSGILAGIAATGYGAVAEIIGAGMLIIGGAIAGYHIIDGIKTLYNFWHTACREATTQADLDRAGQMFAQGVAEVGINTILFLLSAKGLRDIGQPEIPPEAKPEPVDGIPKQVEFDPKQLQAKFKHADDFGVSGNYSSANAEQFEGALRSHISDPNTQLINGTYRGQPADIYFNPNTENAVITDKAGNFVSGWKLSQDQIKYLTTTGNLQ